MPNSYLLKSKQNLETSRDEPNYIGQPMAETVTLGNLLKSFHLKPNVEDNYGMTPLHYAAQAGHEKILLLLLRNNANIEAEDDKGRTPLIRAGAEGHDGVVRVLIDKGANVDRQDIERKTAPYYAFVSGHEAVLREFIENGGEIGEQQHFGSGALNHAVKTRQLAMVEFFIYRELGLILEITEEHRPTVPTLLRELKAIEALLGLKIEGGSHEGGGVLH